MAFTTVTITNDYDLADGTDPVGTVSFTPTAPMVNGTTVVAARVTERLNVDGMLIVELAANTDPTTQPAGAAYLVEESIGTAGREATRRYYVQIPHDQGSTVALSSLASAGVAPAISFPPAVVIEAPLSLSDPRVGCALDGTGDEAAKVATAISLLPATGGHIYQPPGILRTSAIAFDRPVRWEGAGDQASTIKAASGFTGTQVTIPGTAPFSRISDVCIDGGGTATKLILVSSARTRLDHLHLTAQSGSSGAAIHYNGTDANTASAHAGQMSDIRVISCGGYGVYLQGFSYDNEFVNLWVGSCNVGIRIENTDCFFTNLHVWGSTGNGIEVRGANNRFANVYVETNGGHGFDCFNAPRTKIANGSVWKNQNQGVNISTSDRVSVVGLNIYDQGQNGVNGANSLYGQVTNCTFYDDVSSTQSQDRPIVTTGTSDKWIITNNVMLTSEHAVGASSLVGSNNILTNNITS